MSLSTPPPVALTIAGSDSGGGAGIQADLKTFHQWQVYGTSALTAVTAQNTLGVQEVRALPPSLVAAQIDSVFADLPPRAVKCGMLANTAVARAVAAELGRRRPAAFVVDPVMVATSGDRLVDPDAVGVLRDKVLPLATLVTPNWPEAELLTGVREPTPQGMEAAARILVAAGARAALVKGGHLGGDEVVDVFWDGSRLRTFRGRRVATRHTHGTGCTLSAAITAGLARGAPLAEATEAAIRWVRRAIAQAPGLGGGRGPLNHFATTRAGPSRPSAEAEPAQPGCRWPPRPRSGPLRR